MELEVNDMKVLGAIKRGASGLRNIKSVVHLKNEELEKITLNTPCGEIEINKNEILEEIV